MGGIDKGISCTSKQATVKGEHGFCVRQEGMKVLLYGGTSVTLLTTLDVLRDRSTALFFSLIHRKCEGAMFVIQQHFYRRFPSLLSCLHVF